MIAWQSRQFVLDAAELTDAAGLDIEAFHIRTPSGGWQQTAESFVFAICAAYYADTESRIPEAELADRVREAGNQELKDGAAAVIAAASVAGSDGTDIAYIVKRIRDEYIRQATYECVANVDRAGILDRDPAGAVVRLVTGLESIMAPSSDGDGGVTVWNSPESVQARLDRYQQVVTDPTQAGGLRIGFKPFDDKTLGLRPGQALVVVGQTKSGKSALCVAMAIRAMFSEDAAGRTCSVLLANKEMGNDDQSERIEALMMWEKAQRDGLSPESERGLFRSDLVTRIRTASLTNEEKDLYANVLLESLSCESKFWMASPSSYSSIRELRNIVSWVHKRSPLKLLVVDALNQQVVGNSGSGRLSWDAQSEILRELVKIATDFSLALIVEVQEKTDSADVRHVHVANLFAYASDFGKSASHVLRTFRPPDPEGNLVEVQMVASRFAESGWSFPIYCDVGDMRVCDAPSDELQRIEAYCQREQEMGKRRR